MAAVAEAVPQERRTTAAANPLAHQVGHRIHMLSDPRYSQAGKSLAENRTTELGRRLSMKIR
eukprot:COSAG01_NODE_4318_length_5137_cov_14.668718_1_plen_61_part_10